MRALRTRADFVHSDEHNRTGGPNEWELGVTQIFVLLENESLTTDLAETQQVNELQFKNGDFEIFEPIGCLWREIRCQKPP